MEVSEELIELGARAMEEAVYFLVRVNKRNAEGAPYEVVYRGPDTDDPIVVAAFSHRENAAEDADIRNMDAKLRALFTALAQAGWVVVPNMPTKDMLDAYMHALEAPLPEDDKRYPYYRSKAIKRYCAMLAASPSLSTQAEKEGKG